MSRRRVMFGLLAAGATAAGVGVGLYRRPREAAVQASGGTASSGGAGAETVAAGATGSTDSVAALWTQRFDTPDGAVLDMATLRGRPLLLNFWATWCPPCIKEFPLLDRFAREHAAKRWQVLGLAIDRPQPVRDFLARVPVSFHTAIAGMAGMDLMRGLGNTAGALPFSIAFDADGRARHQKLGEISQAELEAWSASLA